MKSTLLLFDSTGLFVAEFSIQSGMCVCAYHPGSIEIEPTLHEWHTYGIPQSVRVDSSDTSTFGTRPVPMSHPDCDAVLRSWAVEHGYTIISIPSEAFSVWELALRAPLKNEDFPRVAHMIGTASHARLDRISEALKRAVIAYENG